MFYDKDSLYLVPNFLNKDKQDILEEIVGADNFPWHLNKSTNGPNPEINSNVICNRNTFDFYMFTHRLIHDNEVISERTDDIIKLIRPSIEEFFGDDKYDIIRSKVNLTTTSPRTRKIFAPHTDANHPMWSIVYFINDVPNSYTLIGKECDDGSCQKKFTLNKKIETKKGSAILFDSRRFHSAGKCPEGMVRYVLNVIVGEKNDLS